MRRAIGSRVCHLAGSRPVNTLNRLFGELSVTWNTRSRLDEIDTLVVESEVQTRGGNTGQPLSVEH